MQVILSGYNGDHPPGDHAGFLAFAESLPTPDVYDKMKDATPLTPVMRCVSGFTLNPKPQTLNPKPRCHVCTWKLEQRNAPSPQLLRKSWTL